MLTRWTILFAVFAVNSISVYSQTISLSPNQTATVLANKLLGKGVTIPASGLTLNCNSNANGLFLNNNPTPNLSLAIDTGIVLCTGRVQTAGTDTGINATRFALASKNWGITATDAQITSIAGSAAAQRDLCYLQFNFVPQGDTTTIDYVFASEDYPEYACSQYVDAFGIFVSPPSSSVFTNYAKVPNTNIPVSINSINDTTKQTGVSNYNAYCASLGSGAPFIQYYTGNLIANHIVYDGMTKILRATIPTQPNLTHSMKIAIADITDGFFDSGIFLKQSSLTSKPKIEITNKGGTNGLNKDTMYLVEGCNPGFVRFTRPAGTTTPITINVSFSGTATSADYTASTSFTLPAGMINYDYNLSAVLDNIQEPLESLRLVFSNTAINYSDTVLFFIKDFSNGVTIFNNKRDTSVCRGQVVNLFYTIADTAFSALWTPATNLSCTNCTSTIYTANTASNVFSTEIVNLRISAAGCASADTPIRIHVQPKPALSLNPNIVACKGDSVQLGLFVSPSTGGTYTYQWLPPTYLSSSVVSNPFANPPTNQSYKVIVSTSAGCKDSLTTTVKVSDVRTEIDSLITNKTTCGLSNGSIKLVGKSAPLGSPPYQYSIDSGVTFVSSNIFNGLSIGSYKVAIKNAGGCRFDTVLSITSGVNPPSANLKIDSTTCGLTNGKATILSKTGKAPITIQWKQGSTVISTDTFIQNKAAGVYTLSLTDSIGCVTQYTLTIGGSTSPSAIYNKTDASCGLNNGSIAATPTSGISPYTFNWSTGSTANTIAGLAAGNYYLTLTDAANCTKIDTISISTSPAITSASASTMSTCGQPNGTATTRVTSGGTKPFVYMWSNSIVTSPINDTFHSITGLSGGKYRFTIQDAQGCTKIDSVIVQSTPAVSVSMQKTNPNCGNANGSIQVNVLSGKPPYTYAWGGGYTTSLRTGLYAGNYIVTVTDSNGCSVVAGALIVNNSLPVLTTSVVQPSCGKPNGRISTTTTNARAPITYSWSNGKTKSSLDSLLPGVYSVTITDSFGCTATKTDTLFQVPYTNFTDSVIQPKCFNSLGSIFLKNIVGKAPVTIYWSDGDTTDKRIGIPAGTYSVIVRDSNNCWKSKTYNFNPKSSPEIKFGITHAICRDTVGSIIDTINKAVKPYTYNWSSGDTTAFLTNKPPGVYTLTVTDSLGCTATKTDSIRRFLPPTYLDSFRKARCGLSNGAVYLYNIKGNSPLNYSWSAGDGLSKPFQTGLPNDTVYLAVTDMFGCTVYDTFDLRSKGAIVPIFDVKPSKCKDSTGKITVTILNGTPPYNIQWSNGDKGVVADSLKHKKYFVSITDSLGCTYTDSIKVIDSTPTKVDFTITNTRCDTPTGKIVATAHSGIPPYKYRWTRNIMDTLPILDKLRVGLYELRVIDSLGCIHDTSTMIFYDHYPQIKDSIVLENCAGNNGEVHITIDSVINPIKIYWNGTLDSVYKKLALKGPANFTILVRDSQKCEAILALTLPENPDKKPTLLKTHPPCGKNLGAISVAVDSPLTYLWNTGDTTSLIDSLAPGIYTVTTTTTKGCTYISTDTLVYTSSPSRGYYNTRPNCGQSDGTIDVAVGSIYGPSFNYRWKKLTASSVFTDFAPTTGTLSFPNIDSGKYVFNFIDAMGCDVMDTIYLRDSSAHKLNWAKTQSYCTNGVGKLKVLPYGGKTPYTFSWYDFSTKDSVINLVAGTYSITVTDNRNCVVVDSAQIVTTVNPTLNLLSEKAKCGKNDGKINTIVNFGTPPFSYSWTGTTATTKNLTNLSGGKYILTVTDSVGCQAIDSVVVQAQPAVIATLTKENAFCDLNNGSVSATILSGTMPYNFSWNGSYNSMIVTGLDSGKYIYHIIDSNNCEFKDSVYVQRIAKPTISNSITHDNCSYKIGAITTNVTGGKPPLSYQWNGGNGTNANLNNLGAGTYTLSVTDSLGCLVTKMLTISDTAGPTLALVIDTATCGNSNGKITANVSSTRTPISYFWNNVSGTSIKTGVNGGKYVVKIVDNRGCIKLDSTALDTVNALLGSFRSKNASCNINNGYIKVVPLGGTGTKSYYWSHTAVNTDSVFGLSPGKYKVTVNDTKGCQWVDSITLIQQGFPTINFNKKDATCRAANGWLKAVVTNNAAKVTYLWNNGSTLDSISNIPPGNYSLTISDGSGCSFNANTSLTSIGMDSIKLSLFHPRCNVNNGRIKAESVNKIGNLTFLWSTGATIDSIQGLSAGMYSVTVSDSICTHTKSDAMIMGTIPDISLTKQDASCGKKNGSMQSSVTQGTSPFTYLWSNGMTSANLFGVDSGNYKITVTDAYGCKDSTAIYVGRVAGLTPIYTIQKTSCGNANGSVSVTTSGGTPNYTYSWNTGATGANLTNLLAGKYWLTIADAASCSVVDTVKIDDRKKPKITENKVQAVCNMANGSIQIIILDGNPPFTYNWSNGKSTAFIDSLAVGIYKLTVTDSLGCTDQKDIDIDPGTPPYLHPDSTKSEQSTCGLSNGKMQALLMRGVDPISYTWSTGHTGKYVANIPPGKHYLTVVDGRNCINIDSLIVTTTTVPQITLDSFQSYCLKPNGSINATIVNGSPPYTFSWSNGSTSQNATNLVQGKYTLIVRDIYNCRDTASSIVLELPNTLKASYDTFGLRCYRDNSGRVTLNATGGQAPYSYTVVTTSSNNNIGGLSAGKHYFTIEDNQGCLYKDSFNLSEPPELIVKLDSVKPLTCYNGNDGMLEVSAKGGNGQYSYLWSPSGQTTPRATGLTQGTHSLTITDIKGCIDTLNYLLLNPSPIEVKSKKIHNKCFADTNGVIALSVSRGTPPYTYSWSNGQTTRDIQQLSTGVYVVTITDTAGCVFVYNDTILSPPKLEVGTPTLKHLVCPDEVDGEIVIRGTKGGSQEYLYSIDGIQFAKQNIFKDLKAGNYSVWVKDKNGCLDSVQTHINDYPKFDIAAYPKDTTVKLTESVLLGYNVVAGNNNWINEVLWSESEGLSCVDCEHPIATTYNNKKYVVKIKYFDRCYDTDTVYIRVIDDNDVYIPNAFAPNAKDRENQSIKIYANKVVKAEFLIFNRWGEKMYETDLGHIQGWDGYYNGEPAPMAVYVYYAKITFFNGRKLEKKGSFTLVR